VTERILVLHDDPGEVLPLLSARCPGARIEAATRGDDVAPALARLQPTAVFSIKHSGFPGEQHAPAVRCSSVRWFHVGGSGYEHLGRWDDGRVTVTNSAGVLAPFLAETAMAALLSLAVGLPRYAAQQQERTWRPHRFRAVAGRTLLIVGVGRVGGELASRAKAMGMRVLGVRASGEPHPAVDAMHGPEALRSLLPQADVVSLHVRATQATQGLLGTDELALMKPGALLLNSARGAVLDQRALVTALELGHVGGAWLDVFAQEPLPTDDPLWARDDVLITPHCADQVDDFPARFAERFCDLRDGLLRGEPLPGLSPG